MESSDSRLTLEQEFQAKIIELSSEQLSRDELKSTLVDFTRQLMIRENVIRQLVEERLLIDI